MKTATDGSYPQKHCKICGKFVYGFDTCTECQKTGRVQEVILDENRLNFYRWYTLYKNNGDELKNRVIAHGGR